MARRLAYFTAPISDNIEETPEGFLVCRDVPIARTGWQDYKVDELPEEAAAKLGIDVSRPSAKISLYRDPSDVFSKDCMASFEGKAVTDNHPEDFVTPENFNKVSKGHVQNVRRSAEEFPDGNEYMIADLHIMAEPLLGKVKNKLVREVSCGYDYALRREGERVLQSDITGNHVAVVPKGRAGPEARINDSAPGAAPADDNAASTEKRGYPVSNIFRHLLGLGLKAYAKDAEPEKVAEAMEAVKDAAIEDLEGFEAGGTFHPIRGSKGYSRSKAGEGRKKRRKAKDSEEEPMNDRRTRLHDALDRLLDSGEGEECPDCGEPMEDCACEEAPVRDRKVKDKKVKDRKVKDKDEDEEEEPEEPEGAEDADLEELKGLLDEFFTEEEEEPEHQEGEEEEEGEPLPAGDEEEPDGGEEAEPSGKEEVADKKGRAKDAADGAMTVLRAIRPFVARSKDAAMKDAFNTALAGVTKRSKASTGSYSRFSSSARARDNVSKTTTRTRAADSAASANEKLQAAYNEAFKGGK